MKTKIVKLSMLLMAFAFAFTLCVSGVNAAASSKLTIKSYSISGSKTPVKFPATFHVKKTTSGKYVYCTYYAKKTPSSGIAYTKKSLVTDSGMSYILRQAYSNVHNDSSFFIYQTALWIYMIDRGKMPGPHATLTSFRGTVNSSNSSNAKKIRSIVSAAKKASKNDTSAPSISFGTKSIKFSLSSDKKNYVSNKIKVNSSTSSYNVSFTSAPSGTTYKKSGNYIYIYVPASKVSKLTTNFKVKISNSKKIYQSYTYKPSNSKYQIMAKTYEDTKSASATMSLTIKKTVSIAVNKVDAKTGKAVKGAKLQIINNSTKKVVDSWTSNGSAHKVTGLGAGSYTLKEVTAPSGYNLNNNTIKFTVGSDGKIVDSNNKKITSISLKDFPVMKVTKVDADTNKQIKGAKLQIINNSTKKVVDSWTSNGSVHNVKALPKGTYILKEVAAPDGYVLSTETIKFTVNADGSMKDANGKSIATLTMKNKKNEVVISKQDIATSKELPGATLQLKDSTGKVIDEWVSTNEAHKMTNLTSGTYTLEETIAPDGYVLSEEKITFTIDKNGNLTDKNGKKISKVVMYNKHKDDKNTLISKQDIATGSELPGATLQVKDSTGKVIDEWVSTNEAHKIENLEEGKYTLTETNAPDGYVLSEETVTFNIDKDGNLVDENGDKLSKVVMYNEKKDEKHTTISKQDITTGNELPGATLQLKDSTGKVISEWVSTNEAHVIKDLAAGKYTLTETIAPEGYELSTETITFNIDEDGNLTNEDGVEIEKVIMYNKPIVNKDVTISKQDITTGSELPGATLQVKDSTGKVIDEWVSTNEAHVIKDLKPGDYSLTETIAPEGYVLSTETITFTIDEDGQLLGEDGSVIDKVVMYNTPELELGKIVISKQDSSSKSALAGAKLQIKDANGNVVSEWVSTTSAHTVENLEPGDYTLSEVAAPEGYVLSTEVIKFTVKDDGTVVLENGTEVKSIVLLNKKEETKTKVSISKQDVTNGEEVPGAHLVVRDSNGNIVDEWVSTDTPHIIEGLKPGTYTLEETIAPDGYILSNEKVTFTVKDDGTTTNVVMYNTPKTEEVPEVPETPTEQVVEVENTASFKNIVSSIVGILSISFGASFIKNYKKKEQN